MVEELTAVTAEPVVRAAGGVVWRPDTFAQPEVLVVHRPKYDDWSLPKGKCDADESAEECALREVAEETGYQCVLGPELPATTYTDRHGRPKQVRYWVMTLHSGDFRPNDEVDAIRWLGIASALSLLSYQRDRDLLAAFGSPPDT